MPAYHSAFNDFKDRLLCGAAMLPLKTKNKGPAAQAPAGQDDVVDEILGYFKANVFFKNFEMKGPADRTLVYGTLYVQHCLSKMERCKDKKEGEKALYTLALENFTIPGDSGFVLGGMFTAPKDRAEADAFRQYFTQLRQEIGQRLIERAYNADGSPNKFWACFSKKKFLGKSL